MLMLAMQQRRGLSPPPLRLMHVLQDALRMVVPSIVAIVEAGTDFLDTGRTLAFTIGVIARCGSPDTLVSVYAVACG
jgi:hypothetical protein